MTSPDLSLVDQYLQALCQQGASDLLLTAGTPPRLRIDGVLAPMSDDVLSPEDTAKIVDGLLDVETHERFRTSTSRGSEWPKTSSDRRLSSSRSTAFSPQIVAAVATRTSRSWPSTVTSSCPSCDRLRSTMFISAMILMRLTSA